MKVYKHKNYEEYLNIQKKHVKNHISKVKKKIDIGNIKIDDFDNIGWIKTKDLNRLYFYLNKYIDMGNIDKMICHGVRCGYESKYFMDKIGVDKVYSTDLSDVFLFDKRNFYKQDFDELPVEWIDKFDVLYSNSIDHSRQPKITLKNWSLQVKEGGILALTFCFSGKITNCDCFTLDTFDDLNYLIKDLPLKMLYSSDIYNRVSDIYFRKEVK